MRSLRARARTLREKNIYLEPGVSRDQTHESLDDETEEQGKSITVSR